MSTKRVTQNWEWLIDGPIEDKNYARTAVMCRMKVPGGWLVIFGNVTQGSSKKGRSLDYNAEHPPCFYGDPQHEWDGGSL